MIQTYIVPKYKKATGEGTLSYAAQQMGVSLSQLLEANPQYKINPDLVKEGAILNYPITPAEKAAEIKTQLEGGETPTGEFGTTYGAIVGAEKPAETQDYSKIWETEYGKSGMEDTKTKIGGIDTDIATRKAQRDQMLLDESGKPIPQWLITGRKKLEVDAATADLNRMIDQRNALAGQYNTGLAEVERKVSYAIDWQKELQRQLAGKTEAERWEKEFGIKLEELGLKKAEAVKPKETDKNRFWAAIDRGRNELQQGETWGNVWNRIKAEFPEVANKTIDDALGMSWREQGAFHKWLAQKTQGKTEKDFYNEL